MNKEKSVVIKFLISGTIGLSFTGCGGGGGSSSSNENNTIRTYHCKRK
ncbi:hypothetical protein [Cetobacterium ceti]